MCLRNNKRGYRLFLWLACFLYLVSVCPYLFQPIFLRLSDFPDILMVLEWNVHMVSLNVVVHIVSPDCGGRLWAPRTMDGDIRTWTWICRYCSNCIRKCLHIGTGWFVVVDLQISIRSLSFLEVELATLMRQCCLWAHIFAFSTLIDISLTFDNSL